MQFWKVRNQKTSLKAFMGLCCSFLKLVWVSVNTGGVNLWKTRWITSTSTVAVTVRLRVRVRVRVRVCIEARESLSVNSSGASVR